MTMTGNTTTTVMVFRIIVALPILVAFPVIIALKVIVAFPVIVALPVIVAFINYINWGSIFTYIGLGPSCTVFYSAPANFRVVHLVIFPDSFRTPIAISEQADFSSCI